ncbi:MAG: acylphosphatase [Bacteroidales bacterium]|nr:acylphosphatase [Bacteroidales bacterium]
MKTLEIHIYGNVYKTGMRYFLKQAAVQTGIKGLVKYTEDYSLLVIAEGPGESLDSFLDFCRLGYIDSEIGDVNVREVNPQNFYTFEILNEYEEEVL